MEGANNKAGGACGPQPKEARRRASIYHPAAPRRCHPIARVAAPRICPPGARAMVDLLFRHRPLLAVGPIGLVGFLGRFPLQLMLGVKELAQSGGPPIERLAGFGIPGFA